MNQKYSPELRERALRIRAEPMPEHRNKSAAVRHVAGLLGMRAEPLPTWARRIEIDEGRVSGVTAGMAEVNKRLKRENAEPRKSSEALKAASVFSAKKTDSDPKANRD